MTAQVKTMMTPMECIEGAEREYAAGNDRESARLLADATDAVFDMLAKSRGLDPSDHLAAALAMGKEEGRLYYYSDKLVFGKTLRLHAEVGFMEKRELWLLESQPIFIRETLRELEVEVPARV